MKCKREGKKVYRVGWDNGEACDTFNLTFTSIRATERFAREWKREMILMEETPAARRDARDVYAWEIHPRVLTSCEDYPGEPCDACQATLEESEYYAELNRLPR